MFYGRPIDNGYISFVENEVEKLAKQFPDIGIDAERYAKGLLYAIDAWRGRFMNDMNMRRYPSTYDPYSKEAKRIEKADLEYNLARDAKTGLYVSDRHMHVENLEKRVTELFSLQITRYLIENDSAFSMIFPKTGNEETIIPFSQNLMLKALGDPMQAAALFKKHMSEVDFYHAASDNDSYRCYTTKFYGNTFALELWDFAMSSLKKLVGGLQYPPHWPEFNHILKSVNYKMVCDTMPPQKATILTRYSWGSAINMNFTNLADPDSLQIPAFYVIFANFMSIFGFYWGGRFTNTKPMHFELSENMVTCF